MERQKNQSNKMILSKENDGGEALDPIVRLKCSSAVIKADGVS